MTENPLSTERFQQIVDALLDDDAEFPIVYFPSFSDLSEENLNLLQSVWNQITPHRKVNLFEHLEVLYESDTLMDLEAIALLALDDSNSVVRTNAIRILWDFSNYKLIPRFIKMMQEDIDLNVRAQAANALGKFIYLGELEEIRPDDLHLVEESLLAVLRSAEHELVRMKALEALGFSSRGEVPALITNAFQSGSYNWIAAALFAMGRSADDEKWETDVLSMLAHPDIRIQREAVRAAGELELKSARKLLLMWIKEHEAEDDIWTESIWALSKIGGEKLVEVFEKLLEEADDEEEQEFLQDAIDNLYLTNGILKDFEMLALDDPTDLPLREYLLQNETIDLEEEAPSWVEDLEEKLAAQVYDDDEDESDDFEDEDDLNLGVLEDEE
ncbi:MAG: hypothetical protein CVU39_16905 [Chloroflexi bacterium HGW-Chloroflexi-10]|nr:MAG: hypothetical protein CVU39_16905 [Chloroflexi bacterium HGW-Chloroflexi-10]